MAILKNRLVQVDGKVRTDKTYPVGFMDTITIPKTGERRGCWQAERSGGFSGQSSFLGAG